MRIGIDVGVLREPKRGVGHYLTNLLKRFSQLTTEDVFYLYSPRPILFKPNEEEDWIYRFGTLLLPGSFWLQTQGRSLLIKDRIETFFGPAHILPFGRGLKAIWKVLAVHDLVSILYPSTMQNYNRFVHRLFFAKSVKSANHIITMSEATKRSIVRYFKVDESKITVIYEGVDEVFQRYEKNETLSVLKQYGIERPYILSVGTLEPRKNYSCLLQAFKRLKVDWDLVIVGKQGWKAKKIFETIHRLKLEEQVRILGYVKDSDLPFFYNGAEIFVFPSLYEGFGLPVLEALACGTPTICSNSSSLPEVGGDAVLYFNPQSADELVFKIKSLLDNEDLRKTLRKKGMERVKWFTWEKTAQKTLEVLKR